MKKRNRFAEALALYTLRLFAATAGRAPTRLGCAAGAAVGALAHAFAPIRRQVVRQNLEIAFGQSHTEPERRRIERAAYRHLGMLGVECLDLWKRGRAWLEPQICEERIAPETEALIRAGEPFLAATGHFGNWEMLGAYYASRFPLTALAKPLHNARLDAELTALRQRYGLELLSSVEKDVAARILQAIRAGRRICFLADQDARRSGLFVPFFGRPASTSMGPAIFAVRHKLPIVPGFLLRLGPGRHRMIVGAPLYPPADTSFREAVEQLTVGHVRALEDMIRQAPSQYFWFHRRWKTQPRSKDRSAV